MSSVKYTKEQKRVIDYRNGNLLVSAAAGSGKTAVLVERIIQLIERGEVDITEILVVTFTNASALEMRERIGDALYKKFLETGESVYREQMFSLAICNISTFHSFCLKIIKDYFYKTKLDIGYSLADEQFVNILKEQAILEVIDRNYENMSDEFSFLERSLETIKTNSVIKSIVLNLYDKAISRPAPKIWLENVAKAQNITSELEYLQSDIFKYAFDEFVSRAQYIKEKVDYAITFIEDNCLEIKAVSDITDMKDKIDALLSFTADKNGFIDCISKISFGTSKRVMNKEKDPIIDKFKSLRNDAKDSFKKLICDFDEIMFDEDKILGQKSSHTIVSALVNLTTEFIDEFATLKLQNNVIDFSDIEHMALNIVYEDDELKKVSNLAVEIRNNFKEILIDEYQDTNYVQDKLISAISKEPIGEPNVFMVGDLKQSIYKFRNSAPEIFASKYKSYTKEKSDYTSISLNKNFRSRKNVLSFINFIFENIMSEKVGDVTYDHEAMLYNGKDFSGDDSAVEIMFGVTDDITDDAIEKEAFVVANKIKELVDGGHFIENKDGSKRTICYKDIVILVRAIKGRVDIFSEVFKKCEIPLLTPSKTGFFSALEIVTILNLLGIIDNPIQDIPLITVLQSSIFNFTDDELIKIKYDNKDIKNAPFYHLIINYISKNKDKLSSKLRNFVSRLQQWRVLKDDITVYELINKIIKDTDYMVHLSFAFGGKNRVNNVKTLIKQAYEFEKDGYKGLYAFNNYIETLKKKNIDFGLSNNLEIDDFVTIMTVHNSKGLEFPVVFLSTMHKQFNMSDIREKLVVHDKLGVGVDMYYPDDGIMIKSPIKKVIKSAINADNLSEEIRLLYVALTRAKERLYLTAGVDEHYIEELGKKIESYRVGDKVSSSLVSSSKSFLDLILIGLCRSSIFNEFLENGAKITNLEQPIMKLSVFSENLQTDDVISSRDFELIDDDIRKEINKNIDFDYPYKSKTTKKLRVTVSELNSESKNDIKYTNVKKQGMITGAELGNLYHMVMKFIDFSKVESEQDVVDFLDYLVEKGATNNEERSAINSEKIYHFFETNLGKRAIKAAKDGKLFREKTFILGVDADDGDIIMVQGMIDMFFIEDGKVVLVDYKTDKIKSGDEKILASRYEKQMSYYKKAIKGFTDLEVGEVCLYSFSLGKKINVEVKEKL